ncbi:MAG TPA: glycosyltransferase family 39 protein [Candidatus Acidoferrales bacterium]|nr:glycosyltransferase family 39 protein [Candidatus Acidoferrales bacterium]
MKKYLEKYTVVILVIILLSGFLVRFYRFDNPVADWHSWRQSDTSAVSRNFVKHGFDLLHPRMNNISNVQSGLENPQGYFFAEFPIYNATQAGLFVLFGGLSIEEWGRIVTMLASVFAGLFLYLIVSRHSNRTIGLLAAFFYLFIPYDIYYGRTILPDTSMVMATVGAIYFFDKWIEKSIKYKVLSIKYWVWFGLALLFTVLALLLKPYALFFVLPMAVLAYNRFGLRLFLRWQLWLFAILSVIPLIAWRTWMLQFPAGIPANAWLFNGNNIRFHPSFFRWIFYERLTKLISGYLGVIIFLFGLYRFRKIKDWLFFVSFLVSSLAYVCVIATGNVQHDYYQILIMPSLAIFFAIGSYYLYQWNYRKLPMGKAVLIICFFSLFWFGWQQVQPYFDIDNPSILAAGKAVQQLTPQDAKVVANYNGDSSLLYQMDRQGWASFEHDMPVLISMGADYLVLVNPTAQDMTWSKKYKVIAHTNQYAIFDLRTR